MNPIKMGVIGCGAIAQVHHMPNLFELQELFEVTCVCDVSAGAAQYVANRFNVPQHVTDYRDLLASDVEAVILCQSDPKTKIAIDSFEAGKHVFVEKPVCFSLEDMDAMIDANKQASTVGQAGYMKVYDPGYEYALREVKSMENIGFVQVNHLHPNNALHVAQFKVESFDDIPTEAGIERNAERKRTVRQAIGDAPPHVERAFFGLSGSMIHDLYTMRHALGEPVRIVSTDIWREGRAWSTTLEYAAGFRAIATWIDLPELWDFKETLEIYGDTKRVIVSYPTGFSRGILSEVTVQGIDENKTTYCHQPHIDWESAFVRELRHMHDCIVNGTANRTPLEDARLDIALILDIIKAYQTQKPIER
ncbi:Gfo/Idh/MocA family oxidoreductase [Chloroflexi bacterium TSY]|nr:Gfo/Idh/MocA family oxidoreductase [Chloroflexi bacterium TSY]